MRWEHACNTKIIILLIMMFKQIGQCCLNWDLSWKWDQRNQKNPIMQDFKGILRRLKDFSGIQFLGLIAYQGQGLSCWLNNSGKKIAFIEIKVYLLLLLLLSLTLCDPIDGSSSKRKKNNVSKGTRMFCIVHI